MKKWDNRLRRSPQQKKRQHYTCFFCFAGEYIYVEYMCIFNSETRYDENVKIYEKWVRLFVSPSNW